MADTSKIRFAPAATTALLVLVAALTQAQPAGPAPPTTTAPNPALQKLGALEAHITKLHGDCLKPGGSPECTVKRWWEVTLAIHDNKELSRPDLIHLRELYLAVSRAWRGHLEGGAGARFDRELATRLMDRARKWGRQP